MASFVEQAVLRLDDQTSAKADVINASLKRLFRTASKFQALNKSLAFDVSGIGKASTQIGKLSQQLNRLQQQAKKGVVINAGGGRGGSGNMSPRGGGGGGGGGGAGGGNLNVGIAPSSWTPMKAILTSFAIQLGHNIQQAVINGFSKGLKTEDVAANQLRLQQIGPEAERASLQSIARIFADQRQTRIGALLSQGQVAGMFAEVLPTVRGDTKAAETLTKLQMQLVQAQIAAGETTDNAVKQAFLFAKAGEQSGKLSDPTTGNFSEARAREFFGVLLKVAPDIGREFTGSFVAQATKYLRTSKFTQDTTGLMTALFLNEEMGSTASVGINQAIKQLSGKGVTKEILANLEKQGLISTKEIAIGSVGSKTSRKRVVDEATAEEDLRQNIAGWVAAQILPRMRKEGMNPDSPIDAAKFASRLTSDRTATDALTSLILRAQELETQVKRAQERDVSPTKQDELLGGSSTLAIAGLQNQWTGMLGSMAKSLDSILVPAVNLVGNAMSRITSFIGAGEEGSGTRAAVTGAAGVGLAAGGLFAGKALIDFFNPLNKSALALNGSALALTRAAVALGGAGVAGKAAGAAGAAAGAAGAAGGAVGTMTKFAKGAGWFGVASIVGGLVADYFSDGPVKQGVQATAATLTATKSQQPGEAKVATNDPYVVELTSQIAALTAQINKNVANEKLPGTAEAANAGLISQRTGLQEEVMRMTGVATQFETTFSTGAAELQKVGPAIDTAAAQFGPTAGSGILAIAGQWGAAAGAAIAAQVNNLSVNLKAPVQGPNVGTTRPQE